MKILVVNAGSSSLKFQLLEMPEKEVLISGVFERIGIDGSFYTMKWNGEKIKNSVDLPTHKEAVKILLDTLVEKNIISDYSEIKGIGHRVVQGADKFDRSVVIDEEVVKIIGELAPLAPLHNPAHIIGINACLSIVPDALEVACFDTAFHQTMPDYNYMYPLPYAWYEENKVRKYGAHGTSHRYIAKRMAEITGKDDLRVISCHIGNGGSVCAIKDGKCYDTSMGLTPTAGIMMGSRCGDIDPMILSYVVKERGMSLEEVTNALNKESGFLGISGKSSDCRDIEEGMKEGDLRCTLSYKMYLKHVIRYISDYYVQLGGADAIVFTAGVGENSAEFREQVVNGVPEWGILGLKALGIAVDVEANKVRGEEKKISTGESTCDVYVIPTNEELMIAEDVMELYQQQ